jgi:hypothetical protein
VLNMVGEMIKIHGRIKACKEAVMACSKILSHPCRGETKTTKILRIVGIKI